MSRPWQQCPDQHIWISYLSPAVQTRDQDSAGGVHLYWGLWGEVLCPQDIYPQLCEEQWGWTLDARCPVLCQAEKGSLFFHKAIIKAEKQPRFPFTAPVQVFEHSLTCFHAKNQLTCFKSLSPEIFTQGKEIPQEFWYPGLANLLSKRQAFLKSLKSFRWISLIPGRAELTKIHWTVEQT